MNKRHLLKLGIASLPALVLFLHPVVADESTIFQAVRKPGRMICGYSKGEPGYSATLDKDHEGLRESKKRLRVL